MMEDRDLDALVYDLLEGDTDRQHGEAILDAVAASEARRQEDPLVQILRQAHQAKAEDDQQ